MSEDSHLNSHSLATTHVAGLLEKSSDGNGGSLWQDEKSFPVNSKTVRACEPEAHFYKDVVNGPTGNGTIPEDPKLSRYHDQANSLSVSGQADSPAGSLSPLEVDDDEQQLLPDDSLFSTYRSQIEMIQDLGKQLEQLKEKKALKVARITETKLEFERLKQVFYNQLATSDKLARDLQRQNTELRSLSQEDCVRQVCYLSMDDATSVAFTRLRHECQEKRARLQQVRDNLQGYKYTPDSTEARVLRLRLKHLLDENKRLGAQSGSVRVEQLQNSSSMVRRLNETHRSLTQVTSQMYDEILSDMEGLQSTVLLLERHLLNAEAVKSALLARLEKHVPEAVVEEILARDRQPLFADPCVDSQTMEVVESESQQTEGGSSALPASLSTSLSSSSLPLTCPCPPGGDMALPNVMTPSCADASNIDSTTTSDSVHVSTSSSLPLKDNVPERTS